MNPWLDLANSPHVVFFRPLLRQLEADGPLAITLRDFSQTVELARRYGISGTVIGCHGGRGRLGKLLNLGQRARALASFAAARGVNLAISHNSYAQILAARARGIRAVTLMDYEGQPANHLAFRLADKVIVPDSFPDASLRRFGARRGRVYKYRGFKEQVYLSEHRLDPDFHRELADACGWPEDWQLEGKVLVVVRTPATMAAYHRFQNPLFDELLRRLERRTDLRVVVIPRTPAQGEQLRRACPRLTVPSRVLAGEDLIAAADLVISAGGTMNREAAVLGTPACTIFAGEIPAVDQSLIEMGRMTAIRNEADLGRIRFEKKGLTTSLRNPGLCAELAEAIRSH